MRRPSPARLFTLTLLAFFTQPTLGQSYPEKPIRVVTTVPGGSLDLTARVIAPRLSERLGQQVIVDNRGGVISMEVVAKHRPTAIPCSSPAQASGRRSSCATTYPGIP